MFRHLIIFLLAILMFSFSYLASAQSNVQFTFGGANDDYGMSVVQTDDKGFLIQSRTSSYGIGDIDVLYTKTDSTGKIQWSKTFGTIARDYAKQIRKDHAGDYVSSNWATPGFRPDDDWHIMRMDPDGNLLNENFYGGGMDDEIHCFNLTSDGAYILAGNTESFASTPKDIWIIKTDYDFIPQWNTIIQLNANEHPRAILEAQTDSYFVLGNQTVSGLSSRNIFLFYLDSSGDILWSKEILASALDDGLEAVFDGQDLICTGYTESYGSGGRDVLVFKISTTGSLIWAKTYGGNGNEEAYSLIQGGDGNYLIGGSTTSWGNGGKDIFLMNIDGDGNLISANTSGGSLDDGFQLFRVETTGQSGYVLSCATYSYGNGGSDVYVMKTDLQGVSCCTQAANNVIVNDVNLNLTDIAVNTTSAMNFPAHNWGSRSESLQSETLCIDGLKIVGEDTVCQSSGPHKYSIQPAVDLNIDWLLPPGAVITGTSGDTVIYLEFGDSQGYIKASITDGCDLGAFDSLYIFIGQGAESDAGSDAQICQGQYYDFNTAIIQPYATNYDSLIWSGGNGYFSDPTTLLPVYYPDGDELGDVALNIIAYGSGNCGNDTSSMLLNILAGPEVSLGNDTAICGNIAVLLDAGPGYDQYQWQDGSQEQTYMAGTAGTFWVNIQTGICTASDTMLIVQDCPSQIWFPNCFTPNNDGYNDVFKPVYENIGYYKLYIFNRWGQLLFESDDVEHSWDGKFKGRECSNGVYVFLAEYEDNLSGEVITVNGSVSILK